MLKLKVMGKNKGIIKLVVIVVIAILILSYFRFDLRSLVESEAAQKNFGYVGDFLTNLWQNYLKTPILWAWGQVFGYFSSNLTAKP